tara:strand:- start:744 stop:884 length:141 start_codon:yes stop_codon:yes gene_type:complete
MAEVSSGPLIYFPCGKCGKKHLAIWGVNFYKKEPNGAFTTVCTEDL